MPLRAVHSALVVALVGLAFNACGKGTSPSNNNSDSGDNPVACQAASDCPDPVGQRCEGGVCVDNKCSANADCPTGMTCNLLQEACVESNPDGGTTTTNSPDGGTTTSGNCQTRYDCASGLICRNGSCTNPATGGTCNADADCPVGNICNFSKQCEAGCTGTDPRDCTAPQLCDPQRFVCAACGVSNPCPTGQSCANGACATTATCTTFSNCTDGLICTSGQCANCTQHSDCVVYGTDSTGAPNRICGTDGLCKSASSSCTDAACQSSLGTSLGYCDTSQSPPMCNTYQCLADTDCSTDGSSTCDTASHTCSGAGQTCDTDTCNTTCSAQMDPTTGAPETCNTATCACNGSGGGAGGTCATNADCPTGQSCGLGICTDEAVNADGSPCSATTCAEAILPGLGGGCVDAVDGHQCDPTGCLLSLFGGGLTGGGSGGTSCCADSDCTNPGETCQGASSLTCSFGLGVGTCGAASTSSGVACF